MRCELGSSVRATSLRPRTGRGRIVLNARTDDACVLTCDDTKRLDSARQMRMWPIKRGRAHVSRPRDLRKRRATDESG